MKMKLKIPLVATLLLSISACGPAPQEKGAGTGTASAAQAADTLLLNGKIYTLDPQQPWVEAVAVKDGKYSFAGSTEDAEQFRGETTEVIDLNGRMAMPGINDTHLHPVMGGLKELYECSFPFSATPDQIAATIKQCAQDNPDAQWIIGGQWDSNLFINHQIDSPRALLDEAAGDKAVLLHSDSGHDGWVNSKALQLAGVDKNTPEVEGGVIGRDQASGEPNGILLENAKSLVTAIVPMWRAEQYEAAVEHAVEVANQYGITGLKDAWASPGALAGYKSVADAGHLNAHVATAIDVTLGIEDDVFDISKIERLRDQYAAPGLDTRFVKIFMDGVPTSSRTAAMLADYLPVEVGGHRHNGSLHYAPERLADLMTQLDQAGFTVKVHTAGDRSVRVTLDAIEQVRAANGNSGLRHELAHAEFVDEQDLPRFAQLQAVADLSPYIWHPSPIFDSIVGALGERSEQFFPIRGFLDAGAPVLAGSDWPAAVPSMNPWVGIEAMVTRADPYGKYPGTVWPEQAVDVADAIKIYTLEGAKALRLGDTTGSVAVGKAADLIVLNQNLFKVPADAIGDTRVEMTWFNGRLVSNYQTPGWASEDL